MNGLSHHYQLGESIFIFRDVRCDFYFLSHFSMKFLCANTIAPEENAASHLWLFCLPMSHKKDARHIWVNISTAKSNYMVIPTLQIGLVHILTVK